MGVGDGESRSMHRTAVMALITVLLVPAGAHAGPRKAAPYSVDRAVVEAALICALGVGENADEAMSFDSMGIYRRGKAQPVLLVHGTGVNADLNFEWNLRRGLLSERFAVCTLDLPNAALTDIQVSAEWVALATQIMYEGTGEEIDIIGHSQGGLVPRWAIKYFSAGRFEVDDYIGLATPNHGTLVADSFVFGCFESCWQMKTTSMFIDALNSADETPFATDYTSIYSATDELVQPIGTQDLKDGTNILLQDICPGRPVDHVGIAADNLTWRLILNALKKDGGADPSALPDDICATGNMPGTTYPDPADFPPDWGDGHFTGREPELKPYAR